MKHLRPLDSVESIKKTIENYNNFLDEIKPIVIDEYKKLAKDKKYFPAQGDKPYFLKDYDDILINEIYSDPNYILFIVTDGSDYDRPEFYIYISNKKLKKALFKRDIQKYNL